MAGELEMKKLVNEKVKPFINKILPDILQRLDDLENMVWPFGKFGERLKTMPSYRIIDKGLEAWKQKTYRVAKPAQDMPFVDETAEIPEAVNEAVDVSSDKALHDAYTNMGE